MSPSPSRRLKTGLSAAALGVLAACAPGPQTPEGAVPVVPDITLSSPEATQLHADFTRDIRPVLQQNCSAEEMEVVEAAWRFQTASVMVRAGISRTAATPQQMAAVQPNVIAAVNALSSQCSGAYWRHQ